MKKKIFSKPYSYKEAFLVVVVVTIIGFLVQILIGTNAIIPKFPNNFYLLLSFLLFLSFSHLILRQNYFFQWISSASVSVAAIVVVCLMVLFMAFLPNNNQHSNIFGFNNIVTSWQMIFTSIILLYNLGLAILRRLKKINTRNIFFFLNHAGLFITLVSAILGSGDIQKYDIEVYENSIPEWRGIKNNKITELDIAIELKDFNIEQYNAELTLFDNKTQKIVVDKKNKPQIVEKGKTIKLDKYKVEIKDFINDAMKVEDKYYIFPNKGSVTAAFVEVFNKKNNKITEGWINSGSFMLSQSTLKLDDDFSLALLQPSPKVFSSKVRLYAQDGTILDTIIKVNEPVSFKGWKIYQLSYDEKFGKWSELSILQIVKDPWLKFVYLGIFMMLIGTFFLFWIGKNNKQ